MSYTFNRHYISIVLDRFKCFQLFFCFLFYCFVYLHIDELEVKSERYLWPVCDGAVRVRPPQAVVSVQRPRAPLRAPVLVQRVSAVGRSLLQWQTHPTVSQSAATTPPQHSKASAAWENRGSSAHLVVEVVQVPGEDASDAVHLLRQEGPAVRPRVHTERGGGRKQRLAQGKVSTLPWARREQEDHLTLIMLWFCWSFSEAQLQEYS